MTESSVCWVFFAVSPWFCSSPLVLSSTFYISTLFPRDLGDVDAVKVIGSEGAVALGTFPLSGVVAHLQTFVAENVETFGENCLLVSRVAAGAAQLGLGKNRNTCVCVGRYWHANNLITSGYCTALSEGVKCTVSLRAEYFYYNSHYAVIPKCKNCQF